MRARLELPRSNPILVVPRSNHACATRAASLVVLSFEDVNLFNLYGGAMIWNFHDGDWIIWQQSINNWPVKLNFRGCQLLSVALLRFLVTGYRSGLRNTSHLSLIKKSLATFFSFSIFTFQVKPHLYDKIWPNLIVIFLNHWLLFHISGKTTFIR